VYHCNVNNCSVHFKSIISDWIKQQAQPDYSTSTLAQDVEQLASAHNTIEKALTNKTENLQLQETKLVDQMQITLVLWQYIPLIKYLIVNSILFCMVSMNSLQKPQYAR